MKEKIENLIKEALKKLSIEEVDFVVEHPVSMANGDYSTNVAMIVAKKVKENPKGLATRVAEAISDEIIEKIEVAGPGFINFYLKPKVFTDELKNILKLGEDYGKNKTLSSQKIMVEYTDPNVMKPFHIGHLMTNAVGESVARLFEYSGAEVKRANYYSDAGLAIAKAVWGMMDLASEMPDESADIVKKTDFLGKAYAHGVKEFETNLELETKIKEINKQIYDGSNPEISRLYEIGKKWSLEHFDILYKKLDSFFDFLIAETSVAGEGLAIVKANTPKIFEESDGAIVFKGEKFDPTLHTRVFVNKEGLPTYEAKELALNKKKKEIFDFDTSIVFTANEQNDYFKVVLKAIEQMWPDISSNTKHFGHGLLRLPDGKMSSRKGNAITGESLISDVEEIARKKMESSTHLDKSDQDEVATEIAVGAIKYSILKQAIGRDIIFDFEKSLSFEGDSGPYIQYTHARALSLIAKGKSQNLEARLPSNLNLEVEPPSEPPCGVSEVEKRLARFQEVALQARIDFAPQQMATYLIELSASFNAYYAQNQIVDLENKEVSQYRLALTKAVSIVLKNGLWLLGIKSPQRM